MVGLSDDTARRFIAVHDRFGSPKFRNLRHLPGPSVLYELAKPSTPEGVIDNVLARAKKGEQVRVADVRNIVRAAPVKVTTERKRIVSVSYVKPPESEADRSFKRDETETARRADLIIAEMDRLWANIADKYAVAADCQHIIDRVLRDEFVEQIADIKEFLELLEEALGVGAQPPAEARPPEMPTTEDADPGIEPKSTTKH